KLDGAGNKLWDKTYGGTELETFASLQQTSDGGYILGGSSESGISGDKTQASRGGNDYWLVKIDAAGNKAWDKRFGGESTDRLQSVRQTTDGGYVLGGNTSSGISGDKEIEKVCTDEDFSNRFMWVVKLDAAGNKQWEQLYGDCRGSESDSSDELRLVLQTKEGGYLIGGRANAGACDQGGCREAYLLLKLDARGNLEWRDAINGRFFDYLYDLQQTADGGFVLGGSSNSPAGGDKSGENIQVCEENEDDEVSCTYDYWVVKLAPLPKGGQLQSFTLIDTGSEQPIQALGEGDTLNLATLPTLKLSVRANTIPPAVGSVKFALSGRQTWTYVDNAGPYALFGDKKGDYNKWTPKPGDYTLLATPYSGKDGKGEAGTPLTIHFTVINQEPFTRVLNFTLINTQTERAIRHLQEGEDLNLATLPTRKLNIRANTEPESVGSVRFTLSGRQKRTYLDNEYPYALFGDENGDYNSWTPAPGSYTLTATSYSRRGGKGRAGDPLILHFTVLDQGLPPLAHPAIQWDKTLGGSSDELYPNAIQQTRDGGYILGGLSLSGISGDKTQASRGNFDYWVVKLDSAGNKQWDKTYGGDQREDLLSLQQTRDGGYILLGQSESGISGDKTQASKGGFDYWVVKLDAQGNKVWDKAFGAGNWEISFSLQQTRDGGYILGGWSHSDAGGDKTQPTRGGADLWIVKLDAQGNQQWDKSFGGSEDDHLFSVRQTPDGGYVLGAASLSGISGDKTQASRGDRDYWVLKLDAQGNKLWDKVFGGTEEDFLQGLELTTDGGFILGGWSYSGIGGDKSQVSRGKRDYWVLKLDGAGKKQWDKTLGGSDDDLFNALLQTRDGGYVVGGGSASPASGDKTQNPQGFGDYWLLQLDAAGNRVWDKTLGGDQWDQITGLDQARDGGIVLAGWTATGIAGDKTEAGRGSWDFWVVKLAPFLQTPGVQSFTLINTSSELPIRLLTDGDELDLASLPAKLNIRADTAPATVGSVTFKLSGQESRTYTDNAAPYALFGDVKGDYEKWYPAPGAYTLQATSFPQKDGKGSAGASLTIHFTVVAGPAARLALGQEARQPEVLSQARVYPNPTSDGRIRVQLPGPTQGPVRYTLVTALGSTLAEGSLPLEEAGPLLEFDFSGQLPAAGVYYLRLEGSGGRQVFKILRR
ncbi:MAG: T9SS type A sorting domain-containing protein, partial [Adhaeribacter sp.]